MLAVFTMLPPDFLSNGAAARETWKTPRTFTANTRSHSSAVRASRSWGATWVVVPALLTRASRRPNSCSTDASILRTIRSSLTSHENSSVLAPFFWARLAVTPAVVHNHIETVSRERDRGGASDPGGSTRDQSNAPVLVHLFSLHSNCWSPVTASLWRRMTSGGTGDSAGGGQSGVNEWAAISRNK